MDKLRTLLQGKKTYILAALAVIAIWLDYFFGIGLSDACADATQVCTISLADAIKATFIAAGFSTLRAGIAK